MSRESRARLEVHHRRIKELRSSLAAMELSTPLPEDLLTLESLRVEQGALMERARTAREMRAVLERERDAASREVLRLTPMPGSGTWALLPGTLLAGILAGGGLFMLWSELSLVRAWPMASSVLALTLSAGLLLRSGWRLGRVQGARGP